MRRGCWRRAPVAVGRRPRRGRLLWRASAVVRRLGVSESTVLQVGDVDSEEQPAPGNVHRHPGRTPILERSRGWVSGYMIPSPGAIRARRCGGQRSAARRGAVGDGHDGVECMALPLLRAEGHSAQADTETREVLSTTATLSRAVVVELDAHATQYPRRVITHQEVTSGRSTPAAPIGRN